MKKHVRLAFILITISGVFCTLFAVIWLQNRLSANDIPEMYALQTAQRLRANPETIGVPLEPVDISESLLPFLSVYDKSGKLVESTALLDGKKVELPKGVVNHAKPGKNHAVTWEPREDVRLATVTVATDKYYVVGGQSIRNAESRIDRIMQWWLFGYAMTLLVILLGNYYLDKGQDAANASRLKTASAKPAAATKPNSSARTGTKKPAKKSSSTRKK